MYTTKTDARVALTNSGVYEWFDFDAIDEEAVIEYMYREHATPEQAAEHFEVA